MSPGLVSICIPTRNRVEFLMEAIASVLQQGHRPLEILIGDDSDNEVAADAACALPLPAGVTLRVFRNRPGLGQSGNVNALFAAAQGETLVLLHDDDLMTPGGLDRLLVEKGRRPDAACVFGQQLVISHEGRVVPGETVRLNALYGRADLAEGQVRSGLVAGLLQQIPNNGFLVDAQLARRTLYRQERELGTAVDADFAIRLAATTDRPILFVRDYVSAYRLSEQSILRSTASQRYHLFYREIEAMNLPAEAAAARATLLGRIAPAAALDAANAGERRLALHILTGAPYRRQLASLHSLAILASVASPASGRRLRPLLRRGLELARALKRREAPLAPDVDWATLDARLQAARALPIAAG